MKRNAEDGAFYKAIVIYSQKAPVIDVERDVLSQGTLLFDVFL